MKTKLISILAAGSLAAFLSTSAQAASLYCSKSEATEGITASNMYFNGVAANDCYGIVGGNLEEKAVAPYANNNSL